MANKKNSWKLGGKRAKIKCKCSGCEGKSEVYSERRCAMCSWIEGGGYYKIDFWIKIEQEKETLMAGNIKKLWEINGDNRFCTVLQGRLMKHI